MDAHAIRLPAAAAGVRVFRETARGARALLLDEETVANVALAVTEATSGVKPRDAARPPVVGG